jgi:cytochrome c551/c552
MMRGFVAMVVLGPALWVALLVAGWAVAAPRGDAGRGRLIFEEKGCAGCHRPQTQEQGIGPALEMIRRPQGLLQLSGRFWNHAPAMFAMFEQQGLKWPDLTVEQMADLMAYLQGEPSRDPPGDLFQGRVVLIRKGCLKCHSLHGEGNSSAADLSQLRDRYESPIVWATTVWNHSPKMAALANRLGVQYARFSGDEMGNLLEFLRSSSPSR